MRRPFVDRRLSRKCHPPSPILHSVRCRGFMSFRAVEPVSGDLVLCRKFRSKLDAARCESRTRLRDAQDDCLFLRFRDCARSARLALA